MSTGEVEEGKEVVRHTIVGGRPRKQHKVKVRIPIGFEKLLCLAAADRSFRASLLESRQAAVEEAGYDLLESETGVLNSLSTPVLEQMIDRIDLPRHSRRTFMRNVATCALAGTAFLHISACLQPVTGAAPDDPEQDTSEDPEDEDDEDGEAEEDGQDNDTLEVEEDLDPSRGISADE